MPGTGNPANYQGLMKSWISEGNLQCHVTKPAQPLTNSSIFVFMSTEKLVFNPQQGNFSLQKTDTITGSHNQSECRVLGPSLHGEILNQTPRPEAQGSQERGGESVQAGGGVETVRSCRPGKAEAAPMKRDCLKMS